MGKNEFGIILPSKLGYEINIALLKGDTKVLYAKLASYMEQNDLSLQEAVSILLSSSKKN